MTVGRSSEKFWIVVIMPPVSFVLNLKLWWYMEEPVSGIMQGALISVYGTDIPSPEFVMMGIPGWEGSPRTHQEDQPWPVGVVDPPKPWSGTSGELSSRRGHCHLLPQPQRWPGSAARPRHRRGSIPSHRLFFCLASLFPHFFLSFSPRLFLGFISSQRDIQQAELCQHFVIWTLEFTGKMLVWVWHWPSCILHP